MKELVVYFYDDVVNILYHNKVISRKLSSVRQGLVVDRTSFMESFLSILKKEKIKSRLFGDKIYIVQDVYFAVYKKIKKEKLGTNLVELSSYL